MAIQRLSNLEFEKWDALGNAISYLIGDGTYERLVNIHWKGRHRMHGRRADDLGYKRFLPWHRAYLIVFERELRRINRSLSIPYWDWNADGGHLKGFPALDDLPFPESRRPRQPGAIKPETSVLEGKSWFTDEDTIPKILAFKNYNDFTKELEDEPHDHGHVWVGGDMASMQSPRDPAFWFHHAQVDRIWALWQQEHPDKMAELSETEAQLDPWETEFTVDNVNNIAELGDNSYEYI